jgi:hypothetical protein
MKDLQLPVTQLQEIIAHERKGQVNLRPSSEPEIDNSEIGKTQLAEISEWLIRQANQRCLDCPYADNVALGGNDVNEK